MTQSDMKIRQATIDDIDAAIKITKANGHFWTPEVDGPEALARILERESNIFLVYEDEVVIGFVLGSWDGARAFIHKISVEPGIREKGIGALLVAEAIERFRKMGAPTVAVAAADGSREEEQDSTTFWKKVGFEPIPARLMIYFDVQGEENED
ncbi:MAG: GNAT family N-acetyltransferase [Thermoplasmata archaeon]|nr:GNAT family N-acetyltransferase [Thermoplasmata archaeon]